MKDKPLNTLSLPLDNSSNASLLAPEPYQVVSLAQWLCGISSPPPSSSRFPPLSREHPQELRRKSDYSENRKEERKTQTKRVLPLIDLRSYESFTKLHLVNPLSYINSSKKLNQNHRQFNHSQTKKRESNDDIYSYTGCDDGSDSDGVIVHLPFHSLESGERSCELPPRNVPFAILIPQQQQQQVSTKIHNFFFATKSKATSQSRKPWLVKQIIYENNDMWNNAREMGIMYENRNEQISDESSQDKNNSSKCDHEDRSRSKSHHRNHDHIFRPLPRLWRPDQMVKSTLLPLLKERLETKLTHNQNKNQSSILSSSQTKPLPVPLSFIVWDLGSGAGRDVCYLAEELKYHLHLSLQRESGKSTNMNMKNIHYNQNDTDVDYTSTIPTPRKATTASKLVKLCIVGIDNHKGSARRCMPLWKHRGVGHITKSLLLDLNKITLFRNELNMSLSIDDNVRLNLEHYDNMKEGGDEEENGGIDCLYAIRFLNRKLVTYIANANSSQQQYEDSTTHHEYICRDYSRVKNQRCHSNETIPTSSIQPLRLKRGTLFAMSHFCKACDGASWNFDHPKVRVVWYV